MITLLDEASMLSGISNICRVNSGQLPLTTAGSSRGSVVFHCSHGSWINGWLLCINTWVPRLPTRFCQFSYGKLRYSHPCSWYRYHCVVISNLQGVTKSVLPERVELVPSQTFPKHVIISKWSFRIKTANAFLQVDNKLPEIPGFGLLFLLLLSYLELYCMLSLQVAQRPYKWYCSESFCWLLVFPSDVSLGNCNGKAHISVNGDWMGVFAWIWRP